MIDVDVTESHQILIDGKVHDSQEALDLVQNLVAALSLTSTVPQEVKPPRKQRPIVQWKQQNKAGGDYAASLPDGRVLRVLKTSDGWIGQIDGEDMVPATFRKGDAQRSLIHLTLG